MEIPHKDQPVGFLAVDRRAVNVASGDCLAGAGPVAAPSGDAIPGMSFQQAKAVAGRRPRGRPPGKGTGRGRGRGRAPLSPPRQDFAGLGAPAERPIQPLAEWLEPGATLQDASAAALVERGIAGLLSASIAGFAAQQPYAKALGAALVLHKEEDRSLDEWIAAVGKVALRGDGPNLTSWEALSVITGVPRQSLPKLCA